MKRVVITGMSALTPIGEDWSTIADSLRAKTSGIVRMNDWDKYEGLNTRLGAPVKGFSVPAHFDRKVTRSMGRVALMGTYVSERAIVDAGLADSSLVKSGHFGVSFGSSSGSPPAIGDFGNMLINHSLDGLTANSYIKMMSHTAAVNIAVYHGICGRIIPTSTACTSGSQGIGYAYETIKMGKQIAMIAGGAEELCGTQAAVFDTLFATSTRNDMPNLTPRPFDKNRDGLVIGEGAGAVLLEEYEHAKARGARIYAEVVGFGTNADGSHVTKPQQATMSVALRLALEDAQIGAQEIGYISAHGTATIRGDTAESHATHAVFGNKTPISALKSYMGHTLGACGAIEIIVGIRSMIVGWFHPTINLTDIDDECAELDFIVGNGRNIECEYFMSNNFAFGGINTSLIIKRL